MSKIGLRIVDLVSNISSVRIENEHHYTKVDVIVENIESAAEQGNAENSSSNSELTVVAVNDTTPSPEHSSGKSALIISEMTELINIPMEKYNRSEDDNNEIISSEEENQTIIADGEEFEPLKSRKRKPKVNDYSKRNEMKKLRNLKKKIDNVFVETKRSRQEDISNEDNVNVEEGEREKVSQPFLLNTFGISHQDVKTVAAKLNISENSVVTIDGDNRGRNYITKTCISQRQELLVKDQINSFEAVESHYSRKDSSKKYLPGVIEYFKNVQTVYGLL
ncbi:unnamed protein product [Ceutorhynchus assimilis]|uniref:Uncharacterized protein n=1 Tax=Ceutorhynchus assimilis TaxID=467358 RepID=A0A9N9QMH5_9CUCU|nr:unnamed protein product [Ceutorhynchus assimilis]